MPLTKRGVKVLASMRKSYGNNKKAESVFYAMQNSGKLKGVEHAKRKSRAKSKKK
jgi:hypothetical protein